MKSRPPPPTQPAPINGDLWLDMTQCPPELLVWTDCDGTGGWEPIGGGMPKPIDPFPGDGNNTIDPMPPGSGTKDDPYILTAIEVPIGGAGETIETISFSNQKPGAIVEFVDQDSDVNGTRFIQPIGVIDSAGEWSGKLYFDDTPESAAETDYTGLLKIGDSSIYYSWTVACKQMATIEKPVILAPGANAGIGADETYTPKTSEITTVVESGDTATLTLQDGNTYKAEDGTDAGQPISETFLAGQTVTGKKDGVPDATGKLTANAVGNTLTVEPNTGDLGDSKGPMGFSNDPTIIEDDTYFYCYDNGAYAQVLRSFDGQEWETFATPGGMLKKTGGVATPGSCVFAPPITAGSTDVYVSTNQGETFTTVATGLTGSIKALASGEDGHYLAMSTTAGVALSTNHGQSWSIGTSTPGNCDFGVWTGSNWLLYGGGSLYSGSGTGAWTTYTGLMGVGSRGLVSDGNGTILSVQNNGYQYSTDHGATFSSQLQIPGKSLYFFAAYGGGKWAIVYDDVHATTDLTNAKWLDKVFRSSSCWLKVLRSSRTA